MRIIYQNDEGGVSVVIPAPDWPRSLDELAALVVPKGKGYKIVNPALVPSDRTFRNAWEADLTGAGRVNTNMVKARDIWRDKLRADRVALFEVLDRDFNIALENNADTSEIAAKRQKLRDIPTNPLIENAQSPEALKALAIDPDTCDLVIVP